MSTISILYCVPLFFRRAPRLPPTLPPHSGYSTPSIPSSSSLLCFRTILLQSLDPVELYHLWPNNMEALLRQSKGVCPFLKKTSPTTLRSLSTSTHQSPGGGTITNLQFIARRCPVMNKALAVQSARINSHRSYGKLATGTGVVKSLLEKKLHTSAEKKASVDPSIFRPAQQGM